MAVGVRHNAKGKIVAIDYLSADGQIHTQSLRVLIVGGNVVETTRLLLNSPSRMFPRGLGNSSGMLGKNYMRHVLAGVVGLMPGPVNLHRGTHQAGLVMDERGHEPQRGFAGGILFLTVPFAPDTLARLLLPGAWGEGITSVLEQYDHLAAMLVHGEDMAQETNRISLHPSRKDHYGLPVPIVHYEDHPNSKRILRFALDRGRKMYESLGAEQTFDMVDVFPATHNMGTARMGTDASISVCNPWGQAHDIENMFICDGSVFPSVGCENPTLTIVALALRQAEYVARQMATNAI
jgi:choline dehydrogenase-like flavoprotein